MRKESPTARWAAWAVRVCTSAGLLLGVVTLTPVARWWAAALAGPWTDPGGDVLIVLGGGLTQPGMVSESSYWRSVYAVWAWRKDKFRAIVLSGERPVTEPMRDFLVSHGVPDSSVRIEERSKSTRENAEYVTELLRGTVDRKVLLTSDYHMYRAYRAFRRAGLEVKPRPFPDAGKRVNHWRNRWTVFCDLVEETGKIAYYQARGWM